MTVGQAPDSDAVVALVEEVPGLLAPDDVGLEHEAELEEAHGLARQVAGERDAVERRGAGAHGPAQPQHGPLRLDDLPEGIDDRPEVR